MSSVAKLTQDTIPTKAAALAAEGIDMAYDITRHSIALASDGGVQLTRFRPAEPAQAVVLCWHGAIESGRIVHSRSGKGLAPWLAERGFDVFVADQRGRNGALPHPARGVRLDQTDVIREEIPAAIDRTLELSGQSQLHVIAHSWGGVLLAAHLARCPTNRKRIASQVYFGSKRCVHSWSPQRLLYVDLIWKGAGALVRGLWGYIPARRLGWGSDDEYAGMHRQSVAWVRPSAWRDTRDGFDYAAALSDGGLPPTLHLAGAVDRALGHPGDVARFVAECGPHTQRQRLLGRSAGLRRDYGHLDMLTHPQAAEEVYPLAKAWLDAHDGKSHP